MMTDTCRHRWEPKDWGKAGLVEGTVVYACKRCPEVRLVSLRKKPTIAHVELPVDLYVTPMTEGQR